MLRPKDDASLLREVRIAIDGETHLPLRVQAFNADKLVFEVAYTHVTFAPPDDSNFTFNPPPGTKLTEAESPAPRTSEPGQDPADHDKDAQQASDNTTVVGSGWSTVLISKLGTDATTNGPDELQGFLSQLKPISGSWGSGRGFRGTAFSVIVTDDGRIAVGAVDLELTRQGPGAVTSAGHRSSPAV